MLPDVLLKSYDVLRAACREAKRVLPDVMHTACDIA